MSKIKAVAFPSRESLAASDFDVDLLQAPAAGWPRLLSRQLAATYLSVSTREIDRLITVGAISVARLPATRHQNGAATTGSNRRVLIDRLELDALCTQIRER